ncbi:DUF72 domain-containing protein [Montanilutibacter psychrotolerans]|uniref:DUF72 domain-containing protein n=1 Tax=Montanilutibacter psychrotolerans TaxID=1327343 RepID=A0A3M8SMN5_9GAMM|nr:DUF72 domain-containing protein [Lysobacter psychrotolerans]RNF82638.1 DUF72 domain-containing protein [Lysobacter psychrotolerans]
MTPTRKSPATSPSPSVGVDVARDDGTPAIDGIRVGVGGWTYAPWRKNFYPAGLVQRRELEYASRRLSAIEVNGTFYGAQKPATYAQWAAQVPDGFVFSLKAPERIMRSRVLAKAGGAIDAFVGDLASLGDRLGPLVWQFDRGPSIDRADFAAFLALLPRTLDGRALRHVLDVRDLAFVDADYLAMARQHGMATVFTDSPEHPSFADLTADFVYARLMQSRADIDSGYPDDELQRWADRARQWSAGGEPDDLPRLDAGPAPATPARDVFVFFIASAKERNPAAAMALIEQLRQDTR